MAPAVPQTTSPSSPHTRRIGPHPSFIQVAQPYMLQSSINRSLAQLGMTEAKEDHIRLQGVAWIDSVRRSLQLPVRTFNTACVYFHKFRLRHSDSEYAGTAAYGAGGVYAEGWANAAAAALFAACKIEDTLKKSKEILAASWNRNVGPGEALASDDQRLEAGSRVVIGLERGMLESAGFDFRGRHPQRGVVKIGRMLGLNEEEARTAWNASLDCYRCWAPLKMTSAAMAVACVELSLMLHRREDREGLQHVLARLAKMYKRWEISRQEVMETLLDLLDMYTHHRALTAIGPLYPLDTFINIRIDLNQEASAANLPRYAAYIPETETSYPQQSNGGGGKSNGTGAAFGSPFTPASPSAIGSRGQSGTVRFMLESGRAREEKRAVDQYLKDEDEEYEEEVEITEEDGARERRQRVR